MSSSVRRLLCWPGIAAVYFAAHLPFLAPSLEDIDSINFALGLREFDIVAHQPHPPGFPVYMALGRMMLWLVELTPNLPAERADAFALSLLSALAGIAALGGAARLFAAVERWSGPARVEPLWPVMLLAVSPLFWVSGLRPMSDLPGLSIALWAQALLVEGVSSPRRLVWGAVLAGLALGLRIQSGALTFPLMVLAVVRQGRADGAGTVLRAGGACAIGVLMWAVPLAIAAGGVGAYLSALDAQADEDFAFVDMLVDEPTLRHTAVAVYETLVQPWGQPALALAMGVGGAAGAGLALWKAPASLGVMLLAFAPYLVYHLLLQDTGTVRYALPTSPLLAWCASRIAVSALPAGRAVVAAIALLALSESIGIGLLYGREAHPAYRALDDARRRAVEQPPAGVYAHFGLRRPLQHGGRGLPFVEPVRQYEWMGPFDYWRQGGDRVVWFFGDPVRTDLALIDPHSLADATRYAWAAAGHGELGGARPLGVEWYRISPPFWFVGEGWSLTPEAGGVTRATARGLDYREIDGWIRRGPAETWIMVGGLHLGVAASGPADLRLQVDGGVVDAWTASPGKPFLRFVRVPSTVSAGAPAYARVSLDATSPSGGPTPEVAIRQFDARGTDGVVWGFGDGWHEAEYDPDSGLRWRWTSDRSVLAVRGRPQRLALRLRGESPLRYFDAPPRVRIAAGGRLLRELRPGDDFAETVTVPADAWQGESVEIAIEVDRLYRPAEAEGSADARSLGLRILDARIDASVP